MWKPWYTDNIDEVFAPHELVWYDCPKFVSKQKSFCNENNQKIWPKDKKDKNENKI